MGSFSFEKWGIGGMVGIFNFNWESNKPTITNVELITDVQIGGGVKICFKKNDPAKVKFPFDINFGLGKYSGFSTDGNNICFNIGLSRGVIPLNVSKTILERDNR